MSNDTQQVSWHTIPLDWRWSHVVTIPDHDTGHPWGEQWPDDWLAAIEHLSGWDYGDAAPETLATHELDSVQSSRVMDCAWVSGAGLYAIVADNYGSISLYRCEEEADTMAKHLNWQQ